MGKIGGGLGAISCVGAQYAQVDLLGQIRAGFAVRRGLGQQAFVNAGQLGLIALQPQHPPHQPPRAVGIAALRIGAQVSGDGGAGLCDGRFVHLGGIEIAILPAGPRHGCAQGNADGHIGRRFRHPFAVRMGEGGKTRTRGGEITGVKGVCGL